MKGWSSAPLQREEPVASSGVPTVSAIKPTLGLATSAGLSGSYTRYNTAVLAPILRIFRISVDQLDQWTSLGMFVLLSLSCAASLRPA